MARSAALRSHGGARPSGADPAPPTPAAPGAAYASRTVPPAPAVGSDTTRRRKAEAKAQRADAEATLGLVLNELRALRETQERILRAIGDLRRLSSAAAPADGGDLDAPDAPEEPAFSRIRDGRRKTVMLLDDDPRTREAAVAELQRAEVPVRAFDDGTAALSAIAEEKPDLIALELGLGGELGGKDLVNLIKATMEWVDIPIVLWTREDVTTQKEARQIHGADEVVPKSSGPAALLACVINVFRR